MRIVYMAHPLGAPTPEGVQANIARAKRWYRWIVDNFEDVAPIAPWLLTVETLDDFNPAHRAHGMEMNRFIIPRCDEFWMVGGRISTGMAGEHEIAMQALRIFDLTWLGEEPPAEVPEKVRALLA
jgi:hypothetical protein